MERSQRRKLIFLFPGHKPKAISFLDPTGNTPEENRRILNEHIGRDSTFFIETGGKTSRIIFPSALKQAGESQEKREKFLSVESNQMQEAERIFVKSVRFSNN